MTSIQNISTPTANPDCRSYDEWWHFIKFMSVLHRVLINEGHSYGKCRRTALHMTLITVNCICDDSTVVRLWWRVHDFVKRLCEDSSCHTLESLSLPVKVYEPSIEFFVLGLFIWSVFYLATWRILFNDASMSVIKECVRNNVNISNCHNIALFTIKTVCRDPYVSKT